MTTEMVTLKMVSVKEFRDHATQHLRTSEPIIIMRGTSPAGVFLPWGESMLPSDIVKKACYDRLVQINFRSKWRNWTCRTRRYSRILRLIEKSVIDANVPSSVET